MRTAPPSTAKPSLLSPEVEVKTSVINVYRAAGYNIPKAQLSEEAVDDAVSRFTYRFYEDRACSNCEYLPDRHSETCEDCSAYKGAACTAKVAVRGKSEYLVLPIGEKEKVIKWMKAHKLTPKVEDKFAVERPIKPFALVRKPWDYQVKAVADLLAAERGTVMSAPRTGKTVMGAMCVQQLRLKTLILGHQREWLDNFMETFVGSKREAAFTDLDPKRIAFCSKVEQFEQTDIALATFQQFLTPRGKLTMQAIRGMFSLVIIDECFTYDHRVITDKGIFKIGDIVSKGLRVNVLSYDHKFHKNVFKLCTSVTIKRTKQLCKVTVGLENFYCTPNHLWWVVNKQRWVEARSLEEGDELLEHRLLKS